MSMVISNTYKEKIDFYYNVLTNTFMSCEKYKLMNIMSLNDANSCISSLEKLNNLLKTCDNDNGDILDTFQFINNSLSNIIKLFGTFRIDDLILICFGKSFYQKNILNSVNYDKYKLISRFCHPINYKVLNWNNKKNQKRNDKNDKQPIQKNKIVDDNMLIERGENFDCFDLARTNQNFKIRISGLKFIIHSIENKQTIVIFCIVDDIVPNCMNYKFINDKLYDLNCIEFDDNIYNKITWSRFIDTVTLKELFIYNIKELYDRYVGIINQVNLLKQKTIYQIVQDFVGSELYIQRNIIIQLLINSDRQEFQYIAYLLYDLLSNENNGNVDTLEQNNILDSLPWKYKQYFKEAMAQTISYTNKLHNFDNNKIPLEQQICLMKVNDYVKEKAMQKLKEVKSKADDSGSKARQYLEGLLKIPFNIFVKEEIFNVKNNIKQEFIKLLNSINSIDVIKYKNCTYIDKIIEVINNSDICCEYKDIHKDYNIYDIVKLLTHLKYDICLSNIFLDYIKNNISKIKKNLIIKFINYINTNYYNNTTEKIDIKTDIDSLKKILYNFIDKNTKKTDEDKNLEPIIEIISPILNKDIYQIYLAIYSYIKKIETYNSNIITYINETNNILDKSVYGHKNAKKSIERIIGQWINGETTGYCFGFEGPPGVGKTSLAKKGIANCLNNDDGVTRPFAFIAIGGSSNGSILDGHNYTYVGSSWGKIVDILIEKRCMNPIIFIDELDKVSKTEHGKEIISILTHLTDSTQNSAFQDKYFSGINIDLSRVLFIFSYNDPELIDRILLDRIHRVKFDNLTLDDKLIITRDYILPEISKNLGLDNSIKINNETIKYLIETYTNEPGVRKLKELLFEILGDINLEILKNNPDYDIPYNLSINTIDLIFKEKTKIKRVKINDLSKVGIINGLWANVLGKGGILHIESSYMTSSNKLELKLTGLQGDIMKESMQVAKTLAWNLLDLETKIRLTNIFEETKQQGIHIHVPEGATPKDGPSAGTAITVCLYSLLTDKKIKNNIAITGEICLQGNITAIGGLELKILGGINAGVDTFLFPEENEQDYNLFLDKYRDKELIKDIKFYKVKNIDEVLKLVLV
tara:strand:- start:6896 stop:10174 length:3279 start_codon:yes stop_codon:yes gene_type:complete